MRPSAEVGRVTLDDRPGADGDFNFRPVGDATPTASGVVKDGEYTAEAPVTRMRVSATAPKVTGQRKAYNTPGSPLADVVIERIPARYNVNSDLVFDITSDTNELNF